MTESIEDRVYDIINTIQPLKRELNRDTTFKELSWDSLDIVEMVSEIEEEFSITISEDEAESLKTLRSVYDIVEKKSS